MLFIQDFDKVSSTYTYLIASGVGKKAVIIDPVLERTDLYLNTLNRLGLKLTYAIDTHTHADHISARAKLRELTRCTTLMGKHDRPADVGIQIYDNEYFDCEDLIFKAIYTPGHTDDSYSFLLNHYLFTGDTLLIGGTGRTDFQNGNPFHAFHSLHYKLLNLPDSVLVYPAHDYKENLVSTIGFEKKNNPRLQVHSAEDYATLMNNLNLPYPQKMDEAYPSNIALGINFSHYVTDNAILTAADFIQLRNKLILIDLREPYERKRDGMISHSISVPYSILDETLLENNFFRVLLDKEKKNCSLKNIVLFCSFGERSALALKKLHELDYTNLKYLKDGFSKIKNT